MLAIIRTILTAYRRNGTVWQFIGLGIVVSIISVVAISISLGETSKIMTDIRVTGIEAIGVVSIIFFVATAWKKARQDHSIHLLLTHYHHRIAIYIAYLCAYVILIWVFYLIITLIAYITMMITSNPPIPWFLSAIWLSFIKMIGLTSIARLLGSVTSGYLASIITLMIYIIGHSTWFVAYYFTRQNSEIQAIIGKILYYIFPNFQALDSHALLAQTTSLIDITRGIIIMIIYSILMVVIGTHIIRHQEL